MPTIKELEEKVSQLENELAEKDATITELVEENKKLKDAKTSVKSEKKAHQITFNGKKLEVSGGAIKIDGVFVVFVKENLPKYEKLGKARLATDSDIEALVANKSNIIKILN